MSQSIPKTTKSWRLQGQDGFDSLKFDAQATLPELGANDILVKFHAASLNYRDLIIPKVSFAHSSTSSRSGRKP